MVSRVKDNKKKLISNKKNPNNGIGPLLDGNGKIINNNAEKADVLLIFLFCIWEENT